MSEPSKTITPAPTAPAWSPDQPLRADATDEQMYKRRIWILRNLPLMNDGQISVKMAREFAHAQVAHLCETTNELLADWERRYAKLEEQVEAAAAGRGEETPDVWAVEWIGDGSHAPVLLRTILGTENQIRDLISKTMNDGYYRAVPLYLRPGRSPAEVPPNWRTSELVNVQRNLIASKMGHEYLADNHDLLDELCAAVAASGFPPSLLTKHENVIAEGRKLAAENGNVADGFIVVREEDVTNILGLDNVRHLYYTSPIP